MKFILLLISTFTLKSHTSEGTNWSKIENEVNSSNGAWKAGYNFPVNVSSNYVKQLMGTIIQKEVDNDNFVGGSFFQPSTFSQTYNEDIPDEFDSRDKWPDCNDVISHIRDQGPCGSCWAVAAASALTDRLCIASKRGIDNSKIVVSVDQILGCTYIGGCWGGFLLMAWWHIKHKGVVTGGDYQSKLGCKPYSIQPCKHQPTSGQRLECKYLSAKTPACLSYCTNSDYTVQYRNDFYKGSFKCFTAKDYFIISGERNIRKAILSGGSVEAGFRVHEDFLMYKSGVYHYITGREVGGHAVKIFGWGVENGMPYWLCANSWNTDWGDSGFFKIRRGTNEGSIEDGVYGAVF